MPARPLAALPLVAALAVALPAAQPAHAQSPAQSYVYGQRAFRHACRPPLKFAAGACVRHCPAGYRNTGGYCRLKSQVF